MRVKSISVLVILCLLMVMLVGCSDGAKEKIGDLVPTGEVEPTEEPRTSDENPYVSDVSGVPTQAVIVEPGQKTEGGTSLDDLRNKYLSTPTPTEVPPTPTPTPEPTSTPTEEPTPSPEPIIEMIEVSGINFPTQVKLGKSFGLTGKINYIDSSLTTLAGRIIDADGNVVIEVIEDLSKLAGGTYDIKPGDINQKIKFGTLELGDYTYKLSISGPTVAEHVLVEKKFSVVKQTTGGGDTYTPSPTPSPTATPKPTAGPIATPTPVVTGTPVPTKTPTGTPVPTKAPTSTPTPTPVVTTGDSGKASMEINGKELVVTVEVKANGDRKAVVTGSDAKDVIKGHNKDILDTLKTGYVWVVAHIKTSVKTSEFSTYETFVPNILIRSSSGSKFSGGDNIPYYLFHTKGSKFDKEYDVVFQVPKGQESKFNLVFGSGQNVFTYKYKK